MASKNIRGDYDTIIIGSGISGLASACILGRVGRKVLVLEQHDRPGGCLHSFHASGFTFSSGNHYLGHFDDMAKKLVSVCGSCVHKHTPHSETFIWDEKKSVSENNWEDIFECTKSKITSMADTMWWIAFIKLAPEWLALLAWAFLCLFHPSSFQPYRSYVKSKWFQMQEGDVGCEPVAMVGAAVSRHYMTGLSRLDPRFVYHCCKTIKRQGGSVVVGKTVVKVTSKGVYIKDGDFVPATTVISSVGALATCSFSNIPLVQKSVQEIGQNVCHRFVFLGLDAPSANVGLPEGVVWIKDNEKYVFASFDDQNGKCAVHLIAEGMKPADMIELFLKHYPIKKHIVYEDSATKHSAKKYLGRFASYGLSCRRDRFCKYRHVRALRPNTSKKYLFLTGQDILLPGIVSALTTAMMTCRQVEGVSLWDTLTKNDIMDRI